METWVIVSWVFVALLTGINIFAFVKLKKLSEQMLKMAFPGAKNMTDALQQAQSMMTAFGGMKRGSAGAGGGPAGLGGDAQLKAAMDMMKKMQQGRR